jgi:2-C-methyl-D-erythritol 4-phosphate cytidylyltransferase
MTSRGNIWAIVPAAGAGKRVGGVVPKQYLSLNDRPLIEWTLKRLLQLDELVRIIVVVSTDDGYWPELEVSRHSRIQRSDGGAERCYSVLNGLNALEGQASDNDWVLVHDAARPCVRVSDIRQLIARAQDTDDGAILAMRVRDTMKISNKNNKIKETINRDSMWHALTPQIFRFGQLKLALVKAIDDGFEVTDEASAMEHAGKHPLLVEGASDNIKVTLPEDLSLAGFFLNKQASIR